MSVCLWNLGSRSSGCSWTQRSIIRRLVSVDIESKRHVNNVEVRHYVFVNSDGSSFSASSSNTAFGNLDLSWEFRHGDSTCRLQEWLEKVEFTTWCRGMKEICTELVPVSSEEVLEMVQLSGLRYYQIRFWIEGNGNLAVVFLYILHTSGSNSFDWNLYWLFFRLKCRSYYELISLIYFLTHLFTLNILPSPSSISSKCHFYLQNEIFILVPNCITIYVLIAIVSEYPSWLCVTILSNTVNIEVKLVARMLTC